ncbi:hypothetical protein VBM87_01560 [Mycoplasma sp. 744]|uniref:hypothetical protein n=1 Tax=Mycoplasma sp. 744 TaxID=3108531 RepID=UPI002B1CEBB0|nr:hypothetical protein [Mycoplasma sp. 744]MEA4115468.1 hypothetical protein [Mycoplasma sp. 744]
MGNVEKLITVTTKTVNDKVIDEIINNLDSNHYELNQIYKDFLFVIDKLGKK